jgi:hypothetical protein
MKFFKLWANAIESETPQERSFLAAWQQRTVQRIAPEIPQSVAAADLTKISVMGAMIAVAALFGCWWEAWLVLLVPVGVAINWFGAAVDGPLGAYRQEAGPKRGLTEHLADLFSQLIVIVAYGFSPFLSLQSSVVILSCYLLFSTYTFIRVTAGRPGQMALIGIGAAEFRILMAGWPFAALALGLARSAPSSFSTLDYAIMLLAAVALISLTLKIIVDGLIITSARG